VSQENVEIVREFLEAFNQGDYAVCLEAIDPDVEWHPPPDIPNAVVAQGRDALISNFQDWLGAWESYRATPEDVVEGAVRFKAYLDHADALKAAGLRE
jgi:ketosteroid isomerase-like protein